MAVQPVQRLGLFEPKDILPLGTRSGTERQPLQVLGNSVLSLLYITAIDVGAIVSVKYYDSGSGTDVGEFNFVGGHPDLNAVTSEASRVLVTRLTDKPVMVWTVTGGNATFGVYAYVVSSFASDLDNALKLNGTVADLLNDKGIVAMGYDAAQGKFYFLPIKDGVLQTSSEPSGDPRIVSSTPGLQTTPGTPQNLVNYTIPGGETWKIRQIDVTCRAYGKIDAYADGVWIGSKRTGPASENVVIHPNPYHNIAATKVILVVFTAMVGGGPVGDVECFVRATKN